MKIAVYLSFAVNVLLFGGKLYAAITSASISVIASLMDSALDLMSGSIVFIISLLIKRTNKYKYPAGKARLESLGLIVTRARTYTHTHS